MSPRRGKQTPRARVASARQRPCILVGAGGHAKVLLECLRLRGVRVLGFIERNARMHGTIVCGLPVLGGDATLARHPPRTVRLVNAVGSTRDLAQRKLVFETLKRRGYEFLTVVHPAATLADRATLAEGAQVMAGAVIQPDAIIGANSIVNTGALVDHDCSVAAHVHLAPGCVLSGGVRIGSETHVGTAAAIIQGVSIGARCLVAAGALVVRDVPDGARVMGLPAVERR